MLNSFLSSADIFGTLGFTLLVMGFSLNFAKKENPKLFFLSIAVDSAAMICFVISIILNVLILIGG